MITAEESQHHTDDKPISEEQGGNLLVFFGRISLFYVIFVQHPQISDWYF